MKTFIHDGIMIRQATAATPASEDSPNNVLGDTQPRPALFLDRDGVIIEDTGYLSRPEEVRLVPGIASLIKRARGLGFAIVVVTNQSGVGRGLYDWQAYGRVQDRLEACLAEQGAALDMILACPFHAKAKDPFSHPNHPCRKPNPGMLYKAAELLPVSLAQSWIVGDKPSDMEAGARAGLAGGALFGRGDQKVPLDLPEGFHIYLIQALDEIRLPSSS